MSKIVAIVFLFLGLLSNAKNSFVIEGKLLVPSVNTTVTLVEYKCGQIIIDKQQINSLGDYKFTLPEYSKEGIYTCIITHETTGASDVSEFDFIVDFKETKIKFNYTNTDFPDILESAINKNWYSFLRLQKFKVEALDRIQDSISNKIKSELKTPADFEALLLKEKKELILAQNNFIKNNYNKWSTYFVKYATNIADAAELNEQTFWSYFDITNPDLLQTPIFQNLIQFYIIKFYKNETVNNYKIGFDKVIAAFSKNSETKKWIVKYIIEGQNEFNNYELLTYFSKKYDYKL